MTHSTVLNGRLRNLPSLTGMRIVAALMVFACHVFLETRFFGGGTGDALSDVFGRAGNLGVGFFFILSGFILTWTARPDDTPVLFWRRRLVKIYPNHLVTLVAAAVLIVVAGGTIGAGEWVPNLLLVQAWIPGPESIALNGVSWSLSCELLFYLSFPFLLARLNRIPERGLVAAAGVVVALIVAAGAFAQFALADQPRLSGVASTVSFQQYWFIYLFPPVRALEFALGMVLAKLVISGRVPRVDLVPAMVFAAAGYALSSFLPFVYGWGGTTSLFIVPLIVAGASADVRGTRSVFRLRSVVWLGEVSFAFYMVHRMVIQQLYRVAAPEGGTFPPLVATGLIVLALGVSLLLAWLLHAAVERPLVRRFSRPRPRHDTREPVVEPVRPR